MEVLLEKKRLEKLAPSREISMALLAKHIGEGFSAKYFKTSEEEVREAAKVLEALQGKGGAFLRAVEEEEGVDDSEGRGEDLEEDKKED